MRKAESKKTDHAETFGTRTETTNVNSFRFLKQTIEHEIGRQVGIRESGGWIVRETRLFDPDRGETFRMRSKEEAHDYRCFPELAARYPRTLDNGVGRP